MPPEFARQSSNAGHSLRRSRSWKCAAQGNQGTRSPTFGARSSPTRCDSGCLAQASGSLERPEVVMKDVEFRAISHNSPEYEAEVALRYSILRQPLGLAFSA